MSANASPASTLNPPSLSVFRPTHSDTDAQIPSSNTHLVSLTEKEPIGDGSSSPSLSSSSSSSSATQPTTPVHSSATLLTTSPASDNLITQDGSLPENKPDHKLCPSLTSSELPNSDTSTAARQQAFFKISPHSKSQSTTVSSKLHADSEDGPSSKSQAATSHLTPQAVAAACSTNIPNPLQTSNVYINGLPPNFKAEQLYALTSQFGTVLSCRTFTRQSADHPSGYGFVLFDSLEAAQQCINVLRSHHNLHPTFAKQAHKIDRTATDPTVVSPTSVNAPIMQPSINAHAGDGTALRTPITSTTTDDASPGVDIYIEGLPINIDVPTLRALLAPHTIKSSRFFADTRVQPPQLVSFVKLVSQAAAQDVRAKLHGRTIRGYSDRLQVFFEDEFAARLASVQTTSPQIATAAVFNVPSGLPLCAQDVFPDSDDPFISVKGGQAKFLSPPSYSHSHSTLSPDNLRPETALRQQISRQLSNQTLDQFNVPPPLQPLSATLSELQKQLDSVRSLLHGYNQTSTLSNPPAVSSPASSNNHHCPSHNRDFLSFKDPNMFEERSQKTALNALRDATTMATGGKQTAGSQLNPLAHTYSLCGVKTNYRGFSPLECVNFNDSRTPTGLGLGAPLFTHYEESTTPSALVTIKQTTNPSHGGECNFKAAPSVATSVAISPCSNGR